MRVLFALRLLLPAALIITTLAPVPCRAAGASVNYERLESLFLQGQYGAVAAESDAVARSGYGRKDEVYYLKGLSQLKTKRYADARESFGYIESTLPHSKRLFDARLGIGDAYMLEGNLNAAAGVYNRMAGEFPSSRNLSEVYGRMATCYSGLGLRDKAALYEDMARKRAPDGFGNGVGITDIRHVDASAAGVIPGRARSFADPAAAAASRGPDEGFSVQTGSFKSRGNASKFAQELASRGYDSRVEASPAFSERLYRVKVGRFASKSGAESMASRLQGDGYMTAICGDGV